jgi:glutamyl-tRNA synthetase
MRTALFAYLYAKKTRGKFILRVEDTDRARFNKDALDDILYCLEWMGIKWDEGPYFQSERLDIYKKYIKELLKKDKAYYCFCTPERLEKLREEQKQNKQAPKYDGLCRNLNKEQIDKNLKDALPHTVRLKTPYEGQTTFNDFLRGDICVENKILDDLVLLKSDGFPTYNFAHVIDDYLMEVTHVIRGEEFISSTPRHVLIHKSLGWDTPVYVHMPVLLSQTGGKLSKRDGATSLRDFIAKGYLKEALTNFMALLGWGPGDDRETFSLKELEKEFDVKNISKSSPVFYFEKLDWFNGIYIRKKTTEELIDLCLPYLQKKNLVSQEVSQEEQNYLLKIIPLLHERIKLLSEIVELSEFFFKEELDYGEEKNLIPKKMDKELTLKVLQYCYDVLNKASDFELATLENLLREGAKELGIKKAGQMFMPVRIAITASKASPGLFETMNVLGKDRVIKRIEKAIGMLKN